MTEQWLPVAGYEGYYEVSDQGRIRAVERRVRHSNERVYRTYPARPISARASGGSPYLKVTLCKDGTQRTLAVHRLVGAAFLGPRPADMELCHNNGDALDNRAENLRYDTHRANIQDCLRMGTQGQARKTHCPHGHEYAVENTRVELNGSRRCRICERNQKRARSAARKAA